MVSDSQIQTARRLRAAMDAAGPQLTDQAASQAALLYPEMALDGKLIRAGSRLRFGDALMRAAIDLWDRPENAPERAPGLWESVLYREGYRLIPDPISVTSKFALGERGFWTDGRLYQSLADNNVYTPAQYPPNWRLLDGGVEGVAP